MNWFSRIKMRLRDIRTLKNLSLDAESEAAKMHELPPGAEHYVLAALNLPDGTARQTFERMGVSPDDFKAAIARQYDNALREVGIKPPELHDSDELPEAAKPTLYQAKPDVSVVFANMKAYGERHPDEPLLGARVLVAVARIDHGVSARALKVMGIKRDELIDAAHAVLSTSPAKGS